MFTVYQLDEEQQKSSKEVFIIAIVAYLAWKLVISPFYFVGFYFLEDLRYFLLPSGASILISFLLKLAGVYLAIQILTQSKPDLYKAMALIGMSFLPILMMAILGLFVRGSYFDYLHYVGLAGSAVIMGFGLKILYDQTIEKAMIASFAVGIAVYFLEDFVAGFIWSSF